MTSTVRSLYRRFVRVAAACVPEQRSFALAYVRERFREQGSAEPGTHAFAEKMSNGWEELGRMVTMLIAKGRLSEEAAARLLHIDPPTQRPPETEPRRVEMRRPAPSIAHPVEPLPRRDWAGADVCAWLEHLGLSEHVPAFVQSRVDGNLLAELDDADLQELGVASRLQRKLVLTRCDGLRRQS